MSTIGYGCIYGDHCEHDPDNRCCNCGELIEVRMKWETPKGHGKYHPEAKRVRIARKRTKTPG